MQTIQKDTNGHENFLNLALRSCKHSPVSRNAYRASVVSFDGSIISTSALPCVVGALCLIENSYGRETTGEVVRIHRDSLEIILTIPSVRYKLATKSPCCSPDKKWRWVRRYLVVWLMAWATHLISCQIQSVMKNICWMVFLLIRSNADKLIRS